MTKTSRRPTRRASATTRIGPILTRLKRHYPDAQCALHHRNALELLVATILSAQCTDARVNQVTPGPWTETLREVPTGTPVGSPAALAAEMCETTVASSPLTPTCLGTFWHFA